MLPLPGPRLGWWLLGVVAVALPLTQMILGATMRPSDPADGVAYKVRVMNMLWRVKHDTEKNLQNRLEAESKRPVAALPTPSTRTDRKDIAERASREKLRKQAAEALIRLDEARAVETESIRKMFQEVLSLPPSEEPELVKSRTRALELLVVHCLATGRYRLAGELGAQIPETTKDLKAAFAAVEPAGARGKVGAMRPAAAADRAKNHKFGLSWGHFTRDRIVARLLVLNDEAARAGRIYRKLHDQRDTVFAAFSMLCVIAALAGLIGMFFWVTSFVRARVALMRGERPWAWLKERFGGLGLLGVYVPDPMVPLLGLGAWLLGFSLAASLLAALPGQRSPGGLAILLQALAGIAVTWAVISAFSRTYPPLAAARIFPSPDTESPWRASTAALQVFSAMLPVILLAILLTNLLIGEEGDPHPVAQLVLGQPDAITLAAMGFAVIVVAPIGEELFFRAFLHQVLRQRLGGLLAALITATLFAAVHGSIAYFPVLFVLGLAFSLAFEWVGSLWVSIFLHGMWNACVFVFILCIAHS